MARYRIGDHQKKQKEQREKIVQKNRLIQDLDEDLKQLEEKIEKKKKALKAKRVQSQRLDSKVRTGMLFFLFM